MNERTYESEEQAVAVMEEALWLAYQASSPRGLGFLQERGGEDREAVVEGFGKSGGADYVFGRMVKLYLTRDGAVVRYGGEPHPGYQSWCGTYPTYAALLEAAEKSREA